MADRKISDLTALTTPASGDYLPIVDISEAAAASKNKRITIEELMRGVPDGTAAAPGIAFETDPNTGIYRPGADQLAVSTGGTERARIDSGGRLLVGTPTSRQSRRGTSNFQTQFQLESNATQTGLATSRFNDAPGSSFVNLQKGRGTIASPAAVIANDITGSIVFSGWDGAAFTNSALIRSEVDGTPGANDMPGRLVFATTADGAVTTTERMRITSAGLVGIATSAPSERLTNNGNFQNIGNAVIGTNSLWTFTGTWRGIKISDRHAIQATPSASSIVISSNAAIGASGWEYTVSGEGAGNYTIAGGIHIFNSAVSGTDGDAVTFTEAMRINSAQELLIGYTTDNGAYKLQVNSQIFATSATVATSDGRYKENVATLNGCIDLVNALRPVSFDWKPQQDITRIDEDGNSVLVREGHNFPDGKQVGFIAQEVQEVLADKPWLGSVIKQNVRPAIEDADGNELAPEEEFFGIAEGNLTAVLTAALQEAIAKIEALEGMVAVNNITIDEQQHQLSTLEARLTALESA